MTNICQWLEIDMREISVPVMLCVLLSSNICLMLLPVRTENSHKSLTKEQ